MHLWLLLSPVWFTNPVTEGMWPKLLLLCVSKPSCGSTVEIWLLLLSCAKSHMLSASRRLPHLLHVSAVDRRQTWSMDRSWRCVTSDENTWHGFISTIRTRGSYYGLWKVLLVPQIQGLECVGKLEKASVFEKSWKMEVLKFLLRKNIQLEAMAHIITGTKKYEQMKPVHKSLTGCQSDNGSLARHLCWCRSASAVWHHHTLQRLVSRCHTALVVPTWDPPVCISVMFHKVWHAAVTEVSSSMVLLCGTVYWLTCVHRTFHWTFSLKLKTFLFGTVC